MTPRIRLAFALGMLGQVLLAGQAQASCAMVPTVAQAVSQNDVVFVGTVVRLENSDRWATVEVDEVWKGEDVPQELEVRSGPKDPPGPVGIATSVDRSFKLGKQYLFFPHRGTGSVYRDNACSATTAFRSELESFRPVAVSSPSPSPESTNEPTSDAAVSPSGNAAEDNSDHHERSGVSSEFLLLGATLLIVAIVLFIQKNTKPMVPVVVAAVAVALLASAFFIDGH